MINQAEKKLHFSIINLRFENEKNNNFGIFSCVFFVLLILNFWFSAVWSIFRSKREKNERKRRKQINIVIQNTAEF